MQRRVAGHVHLAHVDLVSCHLIAEPVTNVVLEREREGIRMVELRTRSLFDRRNSSGPVPSEVGVQCNNARAKRVCIVFCDQVWRDQPRGKTGKTKNGAAPEVFSRG